MTNPFCSTCNRIRLTNDGNLKVCLHSNEEVNLKKLLREGKTDEEIEEEIEKAIKNKKEQHDGMDKLSTGKNRSMIKIGG